MKCGNTDMRKHGFVNTVLRNMPKCGGTYGRNSAGLDYGEPVLLQIRIAGWQENRARGDLLPYARKLKTIFIF